MIVVQCLLEELELRERSRKNHTLGQAKLQFPIIHKFTLYDLEVDTSLFNPEECARRIQSWLAEPPQALTRMSQMI